jgi:rare lipoprotein A
MLMLKTLLATTAGALIVLAAMLVMLIATPPVQAAMCGKASWYGKESCVRPLDCRTANGERYTGLEMTAAHRTLPFGTRLRVSYAGRSVVVRVTDRGPFVRGRVLDLSRAAAQRLGMLRVGVARVCLETLG